MIRRATVVLLLCIACLCALAQRLATSSASPPSAFTPVTDRMLESPDSADWLMWRRTLNGWGYSPLRQITRANVGKLRQVWSHPMETGIQESTPIVHNGILYLPNP